jgi:cell division protein FtsI (penicillin-binding protein 3)
MQESMERARRLRGPDGERLHPAGVRYEPRLKRSYPLGGTMVQVVGLVGEAQDDGPGRVAGRTGLELWLDQVLEGRRGALFGQRDGRGKGFLLGEADLVVPTPGTDVVLTLDARIQEFCLEVLAASVEESRAESASAVVLDAHTGEILACASYPTADPDRLGEPGAEPRNLNLAAVLDLYEPGSIIKPLIVAWGLQTKTISMDEPWDCGGSKGYHFFGPRRVREFLANPGPLTTEGVLIKSSNVGATRIGFERLGVERLWEAFARFGLAGRLPVTFPYVPRCRHTRPEDMRRSGYSPLMTAVSFCQGYEIMLSPLAMARMYLPLANDGLLMEPRLLAQVGDQRIPDPPAVRVIDADVAWSVRQTLRRAVEEGTGRRLQGLPWSVAAKTGTPEITGTLLHNPVVCAIAPASAPRIVVAVVHHKVLKRGPGTYTGGAVSGPPARSIIEKTLRYLRVEADQ